MGSRKVLLVDDEPAFLEVLGKRLAVKGFAVASAPDGATALRTLETDSDIDVVVLDIRMPGLDGIATLAEIRRLNAATGYVADPHSAIAIAAARAEPPGHGVPVVAMATAHPAKFPDAIEQAIGQRPALPPRLSDLFDRPERCVVLPNDIAAVQANVRALVGRNAL